MDKFLQTWGISSRSETRESLDHFRKTSLDYLLRITYTQQSLRKARIPFQGEGDTRPIHCRVALESLEEMNECIAELSKLLYDTSHLPLVVMATRYQTLLILHHIEIQASRLRELLVRYRTICITPSKLAQKHRTSIYDSFETLLQSLTDISQQLRVLNDEARFHEGRQIAIREC